MSESVTDSTRTDEGAPPFLRLFGRYLRDQGLPVTSQREAVALSRIVGLSYEEIAAQMECSESAVRGLVARGLARLSTLLQRG